MISKEYSTFFKELKSNNSKEWFHTHKKRYEHVVKEPFLHLLEQLIPELRGWDERILRDPKKAMFRINRDIRFSKDKSPYHTIMKAGFSPEGKKSIYPGYYLGIDAEKIHVGGGLFMLQPAHLKAIRERISEDTDTFLDLITSKEFRTSFSELKGEKSKRLNKNLLPTTKKTDVIYNKQYYAMSEFSLKDHYDSEALPQYVLGFFEKIRPLNSYLNAALVP